jgi:ABC-type lipoprotein release transport system permease subunit
MIVAAVSLGACLLPARRAARISPREALADS